MPWQRTTRRAIDIEGEGMHRAVRARLRIRPAPAGTGLVFVRTDLGVMIPARAENIRDVAFATTLALRGAEVGTTEHLLAALAGMGVTNAYLDIDGPEVPILDGSALPFVEALRRAGIVDQGVSQPELQVSQVVRVGDDDRWVELRPGRGLTVDYHVRYTAAAVGEQSFRGAIDQECFADHIAPARTFGFLDQVPALRRAGLVRGGTIDNCIVVDGEKILSGRLRFADEFVRHKVLDLLGDLALLEYPLRAEVVAHKAGHALHVAAVHGLLTRPEAWALVEPDRVAPFTVRPYIGEALAEAALA